MNRQYHSLFCIAKDKFFDETSFSYVSICSYECILALRVNYFLTLESQSKKSLIGQIRTSHYLDVWFSLSLTFVLRFALINHAHVPFRTQPSYCLLDQMLISSSDWYCLAKSDLHIGKD